MSSSYQRTAAAARECLAIRARNAASIAGMPLRLIAYERNRVSASLIVERARAHLGKWDWLSAEELLAHESLDSALQGALDSACMDLGTTAHGLRLVAR